MKIQHCFILAAKWLSPRTTARIVAEGGVGWFDLVGNAHIEFPGAYLHAEGIPNPFKEKERTIAWTSQHAQRVLRELLAPDNCGRSWRQRELSTESFPNVSLGTANKVAKRLVDSAYAKETGKGLRLTDPAGLLRDWAGHYRPIHQSTRSYYTTLSGDGLQDRLRDLFESHRDSPPDSRATIALAGISAAVWFAPFLRSSLLCCYVTPAGERAMVQALELQPVEKGANVTLWVTPRSDAFRYRIHLPGGMTTTSLVQTYLDLCTVGEVTASFSGMVVVVTLQSEGTEHPLDLQRLTALAPFTRLGFVSGVDPVGGLLEQPADELVGGFENRGTHQNFQLGDTIAGGLAAGERGHQGLDFCFFGDGDVRIGRFFLAPALRSRRVASVSRREYCSMSCSKCR